MEGPAADPRIAQALTRLEELAEAAPEEHAEVYDEVHSVLAQALSDAQADRGQ